MKKIRYILGIMLGLCLVASGCQNLTEPDSFIPTVTTGDVINVGSTYATLPFVIMGDHEGSATYYFYFSTSEDMKDKVRKEQYTTIKDLTPGTTYYYMACATDGISEIRGEVKSFTTLSNFRIGKVTFTDWDGTVKEASGDYSPIGVTMYRTSGGISHNLKATLDGSVWNLPIEIPAGTISSYVYAYWPYSERDYQHEGSGSVPIQTYKYDGNDYMYAQSEPNEGGATVNINLQHAMARVIFHFSISNNNKNDIAAISSFTLSNGEKVLPTQGYLYLDENGSIGTSTDSFNHPLYYGYGFEIEKGSVHDVTLYSIPTTNTGVITLTLKMSDNNSVSTDLEITTANSWKKGNTYEYDVVYEQSAIIVTDVTVEDWHNNNGGDITVND